MCLLPDGETRCLLQMTGRKVDGTFAEYTVVPYRYLTPVTEEVEDQFIAPILCGGVTIYKGLKICGATPGQWVAISGAGGGVGSLGIQYAKAMGYRVIAIDAGKEKEEYCMQLGAEVYVDVTSGQDTIAIVREKSGGHGAAAVLVTAGSGKAYQDAIPMLGGFGTLVCIGIPPPSQTVNFHPLTFIDLGIRIIGSVVGTRLDIREALAFVQRGLVMPQVHMAKLEDLSKIKEQITSGKVGMTLLRICYFVPNLLVGITNMEELVDFATGYWQIRSSFPSRLTRRIPNELSPASSISQSSGVMLHAHTFDDDCSFGYYEGFSEAQPRTVSDNVQAKLCPDDILNAIIARMWNLLLLFQVCIHKHKENTQSR